MASLIHCLLVVVYWAVAIGWSLFNSRYALVIHDIRETIGKRPDGLEMYRAIGWGDRPRAWRISQLVLNFLGSMVGFVALAYMWHFRLVPPLKLEFTDLLVLLVAFYGITGYLPYILMKSFPGK